MLLTNAFALSTFFLSIHGVPLSQNADKPLPLVIWHGLGDSFEGEGIIEVAELAEAMPWLSVREVVLGSVESRWMRRDERMARKYRAKHKLKPTQRRKLPSSRRASKRARRKIKWWQRLASPTRS